MLKKIAFVAITGLSFTWSSCETEFSLNGEYEITPVVFGLIDHTKDVHIIKITKAFLGDGDNLEYAQNPDSNYFHTVDARVIEYNASGDTTGRKWQLNDSIISGKDTSGVFYGPDQKVYVFYADDLDSTMTYELVADLNEGQHTINAKTDLINGFAVAAGLYYTGYRINFASNTVQNDQDYNSWIFLVTEALNGSRYNYKYTFRWTEYYTDLTTASFSATYNNGDKDQLDPDVPGGHSASFGGLDFYQFVQSVVPDDPNIDHRIIDGIDLRISVAHKDLDQYMDVAKPVSGIAQVNPEYTNINGGLGLFSSRLIFELNNLKLDIYSMKELCTGSYTFSKAFCSNLPEHISEPWYCP